MKRIWFFIFIIILMIGICVAGYFVPDEKPTNLSGELSTLSSNPGSYAKTVAFCNSSNFCQDYRIICRGRVLLEKYPIKDAVIQHPLEWKDERDIDYENLCG